AGARSASRNPDLSGACTTAPNRPNARLPARRNVLRKLKRFQRGSTAQKGSMTTRLTGSAIAVALTLGLAAAAAAQTPKAGEVSRVEGTVTVARPATPDGAP